MLSLEIHILIPSIESRLSKRASSSITTIEKFKTKKTMSNNLKRNLIGSKYSFVCRRAGCYICTRWAFYQLSHDERKSLCMTTESCILPPPTPLGCLKKLLIEHTSHINPSTISCFSVYYFTVVSCTWWINKGYYYYIIIIIILLKYTLLF